MDAFAHPLPLAVALAALVAAPAARAQTVDAGALRAAVTAEPFAIAFEQRDGPTLTTAGGLGFRQGGGWTRASRAELRRDGGALSGTASAGGRTLRLRIERAAEGVIDVVFGVEGAAEAIGAEFVAAAGERYLGLGQRATAVDHRGRVVESYVSDGPYNAEERPFLTAFIPAPGFRFRDDATYFPVPWLLSSRGYGVLADTGATVYHRLDRPDVWSVEATRVPDGTGSAAAPPELRLRVFAGPDPAGVLERFTALTGRQPQVRAPWVWGPWFQGSVDHVKALQAADAPVSVTQTYTHYLPCGDHRAGRPGERARVRDLHALGTAVTTYFNPMLCTDFQPPFDEAAAAGALTRNASGEPYLYRYSTDTQFVVGQFDFSAAAGREHFGRRLDEAIGDGHDGWMEDFGEYTPLDSRSADGSDPAVTHNRYPVQYHCAAWEHVRRLPRQIVRFQRSGWLGAAPCAQVVWGGDPTTDWGFDGLRSTVASGLGMGLSGISTWGSDIGGFFALGARRLTPELLARWIQVGAVSGVMRTQRNGIALPSKDRPQVEEPETLPVWRRYAKLRTQLYPYLRAADHEYRRRGLPIMRHLSLAYPGRHSETQFLFGPDILAAPVLAPGVTEQRVDLPPGRWIDLWRSARYDERSGGLVLGAPRRLEGGEVTVPAPLAELPLFVRDGAVIPMLPPDVSTLYTLRDTRRALLAFPAGRRSWRYPLPRVKRRYTVQAALRFRPCRVRVGRRDVHPRFWRFDAATRVLTARFTSARGPLRVLTCPRRRA